MNKILTGKSKGKKPLGSPKFKWEGNVRMDIKEINVIQGVGLIWIRIAQISWHLPCR